MPEIIYPDIPGLERFPMVRLGHTPTPLEPMTNLSADYPGVKLWIKRDDCTGLGMGGNKVRQLEFYLGDALAKGCDTVLSTGAIQSNYMRTLAAAASKLGLACHIQLEDRVAGKSEVYHLSGNRMLTELFGAQISYFSQEEDENAADKQIRQIATDLENSGRKPYIVPLAPVRKPRGALGYIAAAYEMSEQWRRQGFEPDMVVVGSGSGLTHAGLLYGFAMQKILVSVLGVCVRREATLQRERIRFHCNNLAEMLDLDCRIADDQIVLDDRALAPGYGQISELVKNTIRCAAQREGLLVDPVYSGKVLATLLDRLNNDRNETCTTSIFVHTGGTPALFAYQPELVQKQRVN